MNVMQMSLGIFVDLMEFKVIIDNTMAQIYIFYQGLLIAEILISHEA